MNPKQAIISCVALTAVACRALDFDLLDGWSDAFASTNATWRVQMHGAESAELNWSLVLNKAVVHRGQRTVGASDLAGPIPLTIRTPAIRDGLAGEASLLVQAVSGSEHARVTHPVWILPSDPWTVCRELLRAKALRVFDPSGALIRRLQESSIEPVALRNPVAIAALANGLLIVAEDVSFREYRGLAGALVGAAVGGARVLLPAPREGAMPLPGHADFAGKARPALRMESARALSALDKRLDAEIWPGAASAVSASFRLSADRRQPEAVWGNEVDGWPWLDLDFRESGGRMLAVGWPPARAWDSGPAPRYVRAALLLELSRPPKEEKQ
jgi:hypothetical protein